MRADIEVNGHVISVCAYMRYAPNNKWLGQQNSMHALKEYNEYALVSEMRLITRKYGILSHQKFLRSRPFSMIFDGIFGTSILR